MPAHLLPVFFFGVDSRWMTDGAVSSRFPSDVWALPYPSAQSGCFSVDSALIPCASVTLRGETACWYWLDAEADAQVHRVGGEVARYKLSLTRQII